MNILRYLSVALTSSEAVASIQGVTAGGGVHGPLMGSFLRISLVCCASHQQRLGYFCGLNGKTIWTMKQIIEWLCSSKKKTQTICYKSYMILVKIVLVTIFINRADRQSTPMALSLTETDLISGSRILFTSKPSSVCNFASRQLPCVMLPDS